MFSEWKNLEFLAGFDFIPRCELEPEVLASLSVRPTLIERIGESQKRDENLVKFIQKPEPENKEFEVDREGWLRKQGRLVVPSIDGLRDEVLRECHHSKLTIHPGGNKMYRDMKRTYYREGMKRDIGKFISKCMNCQLVKAEQKKPSGLLQPLEVPTWKWEQVSMDFID